jgi:nucleotide-binding universal stress UspA family protein
MFNKILVPLDGSSLALRILKPLGRLVRSSSTELTLLRVVEPRSEVDHDPLPAAELDMQVQRREVQARLGSEVDPRIQLVRGDPADEIVRYARETGQDLVAMSTHGRSGLDRLVNGSVAERVLHGCEVPLLLCSPRAFGASRVDRFERILVALDGSERSERVLPLVERVAAAHGAEVKLLRVEPFVASEIPSPALSDLWEPQRLEASLGRAVDRLQGAGLNAMASASYGDVPAELLRACDGADLLAITTHGRSGISRWWFGSVAEEVLRRARCPLLVVRTPA